MPITSDFHLHSSFSGDCQTPMEQMAEQAIQNGLKQICFTEHQDIGYPVTEDSPAGAFDLNTDSYLFDLIRIKEKYADRLQVFFGVELGLQPEYWKENARYVKEFDFDFIIGSSHICHGKDPYYPDFFEGRTDKDAYYEYFSSILENIRKFKNFDVYGHLDYVIRYGRKKDEEYSYKDYQDVIDPVLSILIENEKGLELNTGGLAAGLKEPNPCMDILKRYRQLGGEIVTVGSDAHVPDKLSFAFDRAAEFLKECGFAYYCSYEHRLPEYHKL